MELTSLELNAQKEANTEMATRLSDEEERCLMMEQKIRVSNHKTPGWINYYTYMCICNVYMYIVCMYCSFKRTPLSLIFEDIGAKEVIIIIIIIIK